MLKIRPEAVKLNQEQWLKWEKATGSMYRPLVGDVLGILKTIGVPKENKEQELTEDEKYFFETIKRAAGRFRDESGRS